MIIKAGEKPPPEWRERKNALKRGVVAKAKFTAARESFAEFQRTGLVEDGTSRTRANKMYAAYVKWETERGGSVMSQRAFGLQIRRFYSVKKGPGRIIFYVGVVPKVGVSEVFAEGGGQ